VTPSDSAGSKVKEWMQTSRNYLSNGPSYSLFCPKFCCHGNGGQSEVNINDTAK